MYRDRLKYMERRFWKYKIKADITYVVKNYNFAVLLQDLIQGSDFEHEYFSIHTDVKTSNIQISIKEGYCFDGLTSFPDFEKGLPAALIHDCLTQLPQFHFPLMRVTLTRQQRKDFKKYSDLLFKQQLISDGVNRFLANTMYLGVKVGAGYANRIKEI